jgi:signal transduction histidine kinase
LGIPVVRSTAITGFRVARRLRSSDPFAVDTSRVAQYRPAGERRLHVPSLRRLASVDRRSFRVGLGALGIASAPLPAVFLVRSGGLAVLDASVVLPVVVAWSFVVSGFIAWDRRPENRTGPLLLILGLAWTAGALMSPATTSSSLVYTIGVVWRLAWTAGFVYVLISFPRGRLSGRVDRALASAVFVVTVPMQVLWLLFVERELFVVHGLPRNAFLVWPNESVASAIDSAQRIVFLAVSLALVSLIVRRWLRASAPRRRTLGPVLAGAITVVVFSAFVVVSKFQTVPAPLQWALLVADTAVPVALLVSILRARLARSPVADLLIELRANQIQEDIRGALSRALRDPELKIAYWVPSSGRYVDAAGRTVELPLADPARATTRVERGGVPIAALVHDPALRDEPDLIDSVCAAAALALENQRLEAELRARLEELRESRARIVEAGDAERKRIERNLHDGTQQRLASIAMALGLAESKLRATSDVRTIITNAREDLLGALDELRELSRGIHPVVLTERGLKRALKDLAYRTSLPLDLDVAIEERLPEQVEAAAYFVVCEALANVAKHAQASAASIRVERRNGQAVIEVADDGIGGADRRGSGIRGLSDRVEALGGSLSLISPKESGTVLHAEIPCV